MSERPGGTKIPGWLSPHAMILFSPSRMIVASPLQVRPAQALSVFCISMFFIVTVAPSAIDTLTFALPSVPLITAPSLTTVFFVRFLRLTEADAVKAAQTATTMVANSFFMAESYFGCRCIT